MPKNVQEDDWRTRAACRGLDTDLFYSGTTVRAARKVCEQCPVREPCYDEPMSHPWELVGDHYGVWGGSLPKERREAMRAARGAA